jgi:hypothetical protein
MITEQQHYYAATCYFWAVDTTLLGVIAKMRKQYDGESDKTKRNSHMMVFHVPLDVEATYDINWYCPQVEGATQIACEQLFPELQIEEAA